VTARWEIDVPTLDNKPPLNANQRLHWAEKNRRTALVRDGVYWRAKPLAAVGMITVHLRYTVTDKRRRDPSNLMPTQKAAVDGLVQAGLVPDDCPPWVLELVPVIERGPGPRLYLVVQERLEWPDNLPEATHG